jgi:hypothetical protein
VKPGNPSFRARAKGWVAFFLRTAQFAQYSLQNTRHIGAGSVHHPTNQKFLDLPETIYA